MTWRWPNLRKLLVFLIAGGLMLALSACASHRPALNHSAGEKSWKGRTEAELRKEKGEPQSVVATASGKVLVYREEVEERFRGHGYCFSTGQCLPGAKTTYKVFRKVYYSVNPDGIVTNVSDQPPAP